MPKLVRLAIALTISIATHQSAASQSLSVNTTGAVADPSAIVDITSTAKGMLVPRMDKTQKNAIASPANGLLVYQNGPDSIGFHYYDLPNTRWVYINTNGFATDTTAWKITGNTATDSAINFLGTLDNKPLMLRQNNLWMGQLNTSMHNYFIGGGSGFNNTAQQNSAFGDSALFNNTTGIGNTAIGYRSMIGGGAITGGVNVAVGRNSLASITTGSQNVAIGDYAAASMQTGGVNVIIGPGAMESATKGSGNIGLGLWALRTNDSASHNIAIGQSSLYWNDSARNIAIGYEALAYSNRNNITAMGFQAGYLNNYLQADQTLGIENTYLGYQSGYYANTGSYNTAIGNGALVGAGYFNGNSPGNPFYKRNVAVGDSAMANSYGSDNVALGYKALSKSSSTSQHVAVGSRSLFNTTAGYPNTAVGYSSQDSATTAFANTTMGSFSLMTNKRGFNNTAIGNAAMMEAFNGYSTNYLVDNTALGNDALRLTRYYGQTAIGAGALRNDTAGVYNTAVGYLAMYENKTGTVNTAIGTSALRSDTSGSGNTAVGVNSMFNHKTGNNNVAMGYYSLFTNDNGSNNTALGNYAMRTHKNNGENTAVGYEAMYYDSSGSLNTALGWRSLRYNKRGSQNTAIGVGAIEFTDSAYANTAVGRGAMIGGFNTTTNLAYNTVMGFYAGTNMDSVELSTAIGTQAGFNNRGRENTFVGFNSGAGFTASTNLTGIENSGFGTATLTYNTTGYSNTALGMGALYFNTTGKGNIGVGVRALLNNTSGFYNNAMGDSAMFNTTTGNSNSAIGDYALYANTTGSQNAVLGQGAMAGSTTGNRNVSIGAGSMDGRTRGNDNVAVGFWAGRSDSIANQNVYIGREAGSNNQRDEVVAIGYRALRNNTLGATLPSEGQSNVAVGSNSLGSNTLGDQNTALGYYSLWNNTTGVFNTAVGAATLINGNGSGNTAIGSNSMASIISGGYNAAVGSNTLFNNQTGFYNMAMGHRSLFANTSGSYNIAVGINSLTNNLSSSYNIAIGDSALGRTIAAGTAGNLAIGHDAGKINTTGTFNNLIGYGADVLSTGLTNASAIGKQAAVNQSNSMVLGSINGVNGATATASVGIGTTTPGARLHVRRNGASGGTFIANASLLIEDNANSFIQLSNPNSSENGILSTNAGVGIIRSGIVFGTDSTIFLRAGGNVNKMIIDNNGYIGVGSTATYPLTQLHLNEPLAADVNLRISSLSAQVPGIELTKGSGNADWKIFNSTGNLLTLARATDDFITVPQNYYEWGITAYRPTIDNNNSLGLVGQRWTAVFAVNGTIQTSDGKDKENITNLNYGLNEIMKLRPVTYNWKDNPQWGKKIGFIAQEVQPVLGEVVQVGDLKMNNPSTDADGTTTNAVASDKLGIYYSDIIPVAVKAIQEQQQIIKTQQKLIEDLQKRLTKLENK